MSEMKRYDIQLARFCADCYAEMRPADGGDYVLHEDHEAAMRRNVETHAANLAAVESRAQRMEQTIAELRGLLRDVMAAWRTQDGGARGSNLDLAYRVREVLKPVTK